MPPDEIALLAGNFIQAAEQDTLPGQRLVELRGGHTAVARESFTRQINSVLQERLRRLGRYYPINWKTEAIEMKQANIGSHPLFVAAARHRKLFKLLPGRTATIDEPGRLLASSQKCIKSLNRESACSQCAHALWQWGNLYFGAECS